MAASVFQAKSTSCTLSRSPYTSEVSTASSPSFVLQVFCLVLTALLPPGQNISIVRFDAKLWQSSIGLVATESANPYTSTGRFLITSFHSVFLHFIWSVISLFTGLKFLALSLRLSCASSLSAFTSIFFNLSSAFSWEFLLASFILILAWRSPCSWTNVDALSKDNALKTSSLRNMSGLTSAGNMSLFLLTCSTSSLAFLLLSTPFGTPGTSFLFSVLDSLLLRGE